jgi:hypothetical protein
MDIPTPPLGTADDPPTPSHLSTSLPQPSLPTSTTQTPFTPTFTTQTPSTTSTPQTPSLPTSTPQAPSTPQPHKQLLETVAVEFIEKGWRLVSELHKKKEYPLASVNSIPIGQPIGIVFILFFYLLNP